MISLPRSSCLGFEVSGYDRPANAIGLANNGATTYERINVITLYLLILKITRIKSCCSNC